MQDFSKEAAKAAQKLCGNGKCHYNLGCGHANNEPRWPVLHKGAKCPLEKYAVSPDSNPKPWWERKADEVWMTRDELFYLCANCENGELREDGDGLYVHRKSLDPCMDCPVKGAEEAMDETEAEASMS